MRLLGHFKPDRVPADLRRAWTKHHVAGVVPYKLAQVTFLHRFLAFIDVPSVRVVHSFDSWREVIVPPMKWALLVGHEDDVDRENVAYTAVPFAAEFSVDEGRVLHIRFCA